MYLSHFGLTEAPFRITPHTDFFFDGANRGATLEALLYAITNDEGIVKVTGEVGSGKTMLCRVLIERLPPGVETIYLANPSLERDEIVLAILDDLKVASSHERSTLLLRDLQEHLIRLYAEGRRVVVLVDEAHAMPAETLEEIRLLSNLESKRHKLLQIVLFGQQELDDVLGTAQMRQLKERIVHSFRLEPLIHSDIGTYLIFRMRQAGYKGPNLFSKGAVKLIVGASQGLTRRINILADKALLAAFSEGEHEILAHHVKIALADSEFSRLQQRRHSTRTLVAAGLVLVAGGALAAAFALSVFRGSPATGTMVNVGPVKLQTTTVLSGRGAGQERLDNGNLQQAPVPATIFPDNAGQAFPLLTHRQKATRAWLQTVRDSEFTIGLLTVDARKADELEAWIAQLPADIKREAVYVYSAPHRGATELRAIYGSFDDEPAANAAIRSLPRSLTALQPEARAISSIRAELRPK